MSDEFLLKTFEDLCYRTNGDAVDPDAWYEEWRAVKDEILRRMKGRL